MPGSAITASPVSRDPTPMEDADHVDAPDTVSNSVPKEKSTGVGLANPQMSQSRRYMLDLVNRLHSTGVQVDIDLPQIAVIGSQSAGKSSLIESISGVTLPRSAGTCTRCPTECRLSYSNTPWKCNVFLRFITDAKGTPLGQTKNEAFGPTIIHKSQVEDRIRRAQRAILNPSQPARLFLKDDGKTVVEDELSFSNNCVSLQISGPDVADLSFCDLPGLIASVGGGGSANDIKLVESLVTSYIKKPSCIILLTVACETDFENQGAHQIAKEYDPEGKRTIGVLTKPDRIPTGEETGWLRFIKNEGEPLNNNWYCVKQPSSNDLKKNWTWEKARQKERDFFAVTLPWSELEGMYRKYLQTTNLVERLSSVLSDLIAKRLPEIQDELEKSIQATMDLLAQLPRAPSKQPINEVATLLHEFVADVNRHITGIAAEKGLIQLIRPSQESFRAEIRATAPKFSPYKRKGGSKRSMPRAKFLDNEDDGDIDDDGDADDDEGADGGGATVGGGCFEVDENSEDDPDYVDDRNSEGDGDGDSESGGDDSEGDEDGDSEGERDGDGDSEGERDGDSEGDGDPEGDGDGDSEDDGNFEDECANASVNDTVTGKRKRGNSVVYVDEVFERAQRARTRELPGNYPPVVQEGYIKDCIKDWKSPAHALCKAVYKIVSEYLKDMVHTHFGEFGQGILEHRVRLLIQDHLKTCLTKTEEKVTWLLDLENNAFSLNTHYFADYKAKFLAHYRSARRQNKHGNLMDTINAYTLQPQRSSNSVDRDPPTAISKVLSGLAELGLPGIRPEDLAKLCSGDEMEPALEIMADVRAYFQVAYKRFADNIPMAIDHELVWGAGRNIHSLLREGLRLNTTEVLSICQELAQESPSVADRRDELTKKLERLNEASQQLLLISGA